MTFSFRFGQRRALITTLLMLALAAALPVSGQEPEGLKGLDALVERGLKDWQVPGLAVAVVKDGKVILAKGYGVRNLKTREAVGPETLFYLASASKSFTATLAAMMVEEKLIAWDAPLRTYFPSFRMFDPVATDRVTFRDLLCHRTGLPRQEFLKIHAPDQRADLIERIRYFEPAREFRSGFLYCNETVTVAGDLLGRRAGKAWEGLVQERIFAPLGMGRTVCSVEAMRQKGDYAFPHIVRDAAPEEMDFYDVSALRGPAGGIITCVDDLARWVLFNLNRGQWEGKKLLSPQGLALLQTPQMPSPPFPPRFKEMSYQSYGLGWFIDAYRGVPRVSHPGNLYGFSSLVSFLPGEKVGVAVLANLNGTPLPDIVERFVYDRLLGQAPVDWNRRLLDDRDKMRTAAARQAQQPDPDRKPGTSLSHPLDAYAGTYTHPGYGTVVVRREGDLLKARVHSGEFPLKHYHYDVFELYHPVEDSSWLLAFRSDLRGEISSFSVEIGPGLKEIVFSKTGDKE